MLLSEPQTGTDNVNYRKSRFPVAAYTDSGTDYHPQITPPAPKSLTYKHCVELDTRKAEIKGPFKLFWLVSDHGHAWLQFVGGWLTGQLWEVLAATVAIEADWAPSGAAPSAVTLMSSYTCNAIQNVSALGREPICVAQPADLSFNGARKLTGYWGWWAPPWSHLKDLHNAAGAFRMALSPRALTGPVGTQLAAEANPCLDLLVTVVDVVLRVGCPGNSCELWFSRG